MSAKNAGRRGVTLLEIVVALVIVGTTAGAALLAIRPVPSEADETRQTLTAVIADARRAAIAAGEPRTLRVRVQDDWDVVSESSDNVTGSVQFVTILPSGEVVAATSLGIARLTGRVVITIGRAP